MGQSAPTITVNSGNLSTSAAEAQQKRKARLMTILAEGLPSLPTYVFELNSLLSNPAVDLKKVSKIIRTDPSLSAQVLRMCNSAALGTRRRVLSISEAAVVLGTERLRTLVLTCSMMEYTGRKLPSAAVQAFWQHSFLTALLSERIARWMDYFEKEQAYLGGLLHDIGQLPLWIVAQEEQARGSSVPPLDWQDNLALEHEYFGMDHCEVGRWMGISWNFFSSFVDVFESHHNPSAVLHDPYLVGIVAAADHYCRTHSAPASAAPQEQPVPPATAEDDFLHTCLPQLYAEDRAALAEMLEAEYLHLLPIIEYGTMLGPGQSDASGISSSREKKPK
jgi:putative nucleotidyltransferase with HDIG domain